MGTILQAILGSLAGGSGAGSAVANLGKWAALVSIAVPGWQWFQGHRDEIAIAFTWAQIGGVGAIVYAMLEIVHRARGPGQ